MYPPLMTQRPSSSRLLGQESNLLLMGGEPSKVRDTTEAGIGDETILQIWQLIGTHGQNYVEESRILFSFYFLFFILFLYFFFLK